MQGSRSHATFYLVRHGYLHFLQLEKQSWYFNGFSAYSTRSKDFSYLYSTLFEIRIFKNCCSGNWKNTQSHLEYLLRVQHGGKKVSTILMSAIICITSRLESLLFWPTSGISRKKCLKSQSSNNKTWIIKNYKPLT